MQTRGQRDKLRFSIANAKLKRLKKRMGVKRMYSISLPSGWTCPGATLCLSKADRITGKITDGPDTIFRCFSATLEAMSPQLRAMAWHNFDLIKAAKTREAIAALILDSLPVDAEVCRIHVGGDMYSLAYMASWIDVANARPNVIFYAYTKSIHHWQRLGELPPNLEFTASKGGLFDHLIAQRKSATVVFHPDEAAQLGLEIDHDDSHAATGKESFALLIHGTQPKGTAAAAAIKRLKAEEIEYSYA
jgi:hypothetical protein